MTGFHSLLAQFAPSPQPDGPPDKPLKSPKPQPAPRQPAPPQSQQAPAQKPIPKGPGINPGDGNTGPGGATEPTEPAEPEFEIGDAVTLNETILGLREGDPGQVMGVQDYMLAVLFQSNPQAAIWLDKDLVSSSDSGDDSTEGDGQSDGPAPVMAAYRKMADAFASSDLIRGTVDAHTTSRTDLPNEAIALAGEFLNQFIWPVTPTLTYRGIRHATRDEDTPALEADAQIILGAKVYTTSGVRTDLEIPVFVRGNELLEPSIAIFAGSPRILAQSLIDEIVNSGTFRAKVDPRGGMFGPPMTRESLDLWLSTDDEFKERDRPSRNMYSIAGKTAGVTVPQALQELAKLVTEGYTGTDILIAAYTHFPTIAEAVIQAASEKGMLDDLDPDLSI